MLCPRYICKELHLLISYPQYHQSRPKQGLVPCESTYQHASSKKGELGGIGVKTDLMLARSMGREREPAFRAILPGQNDLERKGFSQSHCVELEGA